MKLARPLIAMALVGALAVGAYTVLSRNTPAPDVPMVLLNGQSQRMSDLRGQVVLVNFWATSCSTCMHEMPKLVEIYQQHKGKGLRTVAVAMSYDPPAFVANYALSRQLPFDVAIDNTGKVAEGFGRVQLTPTTFVVNKRGQIVKQYVGEPDYVALNALIVQLQGEPG
ncbi:TlpA disulfide reductase family protein [Aquabacterium sp.]|uniref:TlpA disulfide reductase family protein n=1 Tax=Aquabacterium sp. TaxID=1872578 RepID=UPI0035AED598